MKTILLIIVSFLTGAHCAHAQWYRVNTNTTENLYDLFFVDSLEGYCVGGSDDWGAPQSKGVILKTTDGGENWTTIFSKDSLTIRNIATVEIFGNIKLYAFALKNGASHLVSTVVNTLFQNWSLTPISYNPKEVRVNSNKIYFLDHTIGQGLKKIDANVVFNVIENPNILTYHVDKDIFTLSNLNLDSIFTASDTSPDLQFLTTWPLNIIGQNQSLYANLYRRNDTIIVKGTYPSTVLFSMDNGITWDYFRGGGEGKSLILETGQIISLNINSNQILTTNDFGQNWDKSTINGVIFTDVVYSKYDSTIYALGKNGVIYKNRNLATVGLDKLEQKKRIKIYPNPTMKVLRIELSPGVQLEQIELFDSSGKKLKTFNKNERTLDISGLNSGNYLLKLRNKEGLFTEKVLIR